MSDDIQLIGPGAQGAGGGGSGKIQVWSSVLAEIDQHVESDTTVEQGGVLVGDLDAATGATVITARIPAVGAISEVASLRFTHETWDHINGVMERDHPDARMVGWYHSHPHFGIFLSDYDQFIHNNFFSQPWQVAYVVDPLLRQRGFFAWVDGNLVRVPSWETWHTETGVAGAADAPVGSPPPRPAAPPPAPPVAGAPPATGPVAPHPPDPDKISPWSLGLLLVLVLALVAAVIAVTDPFADDTEPAFRIVVPDRGLRHEATAGKPTLLGRVTLTGADKDDPLVWMYLPTEGDSPPNAVTATRTREESGLTYKLSWQSADVHDNGPRAGVLVVSRCSADAVGAVCSPDETEIAATPIAVTLTSPDLTVPGTEQFSADEGTLPSVEGERLVVDDGTVAGQIGAEAIGTLTVGSTVIDQLDVSNVDEATLTITPSLALDLGFEQGADVDPAPPLSEDDRGSMNAKDLSAGPPSIDVNVIDPSGGAERTRGIACGADGVSRHCRPAAMLPDGRRGEIYSTVEVLNAIAEVPDRTVAGLFLTLPETCVPPGEDEIDRTMEVVAAAVRARTEVLWVVPDTPTCANLADHLAAVDNVVTVNAGDDEQPAEVEVRPTALPGDEETDDGHTADARDAAAIVMGAAAETWSADPDDLTAVAVVGCLVSTLKDGEELKVGAARDQCAPIDPPTPTTPPGTVDTMTPDASQTTTTTTTTPAAEAPDDAPCVHPAPAPPQTAPNPRPFVCPTS